MSLDHTTKTCTKCKLIFPLTSEFWVRNSATKDGFHSICKICKRQQDRDYYRSTPEIKERAIQRAVQWRKDHHEYRLEYEAEYRMQNPEKAKNYYRDNRINVLRRAKEWRLANLEIERQKDRDWLKANRHKKQQYYRNNPELRRAGVLRRLARKKNLPNTLNGKQSAAIRDYWGYCCAVCGRSEGNGLIIALDHWIPLNDRRDHNPGTVASNIIPLCHSMGTGALGCNQNKSDKDPIKWLREKLGEAATLKLAEIKVYFEWIKNSG